MCGISGYIGFQEGINDQSIKTTFELMRNRGPDSSGLFSENFGDGKCIKLLHTRLSIIDLTENANQPFKINGNVLSFNGEIYNYIELKKELKNKKYKFLTNSDTEVLLQSYNEYDQKCVNFFNGMWSFAIWDTKKKRLFLSRDIFGEKPLFYYKSKYGIYFGSEVKFIKSLSQKKFKINYRKIFDNLGNGYKSLFKDSDTYFKEIFRINSGENVFIDQNLEVTKKKYWKPTLNINNDQSIKEVILSTKQKLIRSIELKLRSDVPLALSLSGGIDSCLLASIIYKEFGKKIDTFSIIDNDSRYNESKNINILKNELKCKNFKIDLSKNKNNFFNELEDLVKYHDSPVSTISSYVHSFITKQISKKGYKVFVSGIGADEIFTGYYDHFLLFFNEIKESNNYDK